MPQLDAVALGVGDPAEATDTVHLLRLTGDVGALRPELREHRVEVLDGLDALLDAHAQEHDGPHHDPDLEDQERQADRDEIRHFETIG